MSVIDYTSKASIYNKYRTLKWCNIIKSGWNRHLASSAFLNCPTNSRLTNIFERFLFLLKAVLIAFRFDGIERFLFYFLTHFQYGRMAYNHGAVRNILIFKKFSTSKTKSHEVNSKCPVYIRNSDLHRNLNIKMVALEIN